ACASSRLWCQRPWPGLALPGGARRHAAPAPTTCPGSRPRSMSSTGREPGRTCMSDAVASPAIGTQTSGQIFSRESSGLVRIGSPWRMLLLNVANVGVVYIMFTYWSFPAIFPQSNLLVAIPIAAAFALPFNLLYGMLSSIMPRTGSEYVFLSRSFPPAIGFMASFAAAMSQSFWVGIGGYWIAQFVLGPMF